MQATDPGRADGARRKARALLQGETGTTVVLTAVLFGLGFLTGPLLAHSLGATGRGDLAAVLVPTTLLGTVLGFGFPQAAVYLHRRFSRRALLGSSLAWAAAVGIPLATVAWLLAPRYLQDNDPITVGWFRFFVVNAVFAIPVAVALDLHRAAQEMRRYNFLRSIVAVWNAVAVGALAVLDRLTLTSALVAMATATGAATLLTLGAARRWGRPTVERAVFRAQFGYGSRVAVGTWADSVVARLDQLLLVGLVSPALLGLYAVAVTASTISSPFAAGLALVLFPRVARATDVADAEHQLRRTRILTLAASTGIAVAVGATARVVLPLVFGDDFEDSTTALLLLLPGRVVADQVTVVSNYLFGIGRPGNASAASVLAAVVTAAGLPFAVSHWDIEGAAAVTSISYVAQLAYLEVQRRRIGGSWIADRLDPDEPTELDAPPPAEAGPATDGLPGDPA